MSSKVYSLLLATAFAVSLAAAPATFDFNDPKGVNHVVFMLDAPLEFISGTGTGITGTVEYDPAAPEKTHGEIILTTASLEVTNKKMSKAMKGKKWLHAEQNEEIRFRFDGLTVESQKDATTTGTVTGTLSFLGVDQALTAPVRLTLVKDGADDRGMAQGDLLVVRSEFSLELDTFGLKINAASRLKVSNEPQIKVIIAGYPAKD